MKICCPGDWIETNIRLSASLKQPDVCLFVELSTNIVGVCFGFVAFHIFPGDQTTTVQFEWVVKNFLLDLNKHSIFNPLYT